MKRNLNIIIESGETTCASSPGIFCKYRIEADFTGINPFCRLFSQQLEDKDGWLQRLPECLAAEKESEESPK